MSAIFQQAAWKPMCQNEAGFRSRLTATTEGQPLINPVHLRTLVEVIRLGSFAAAATRLGYTASAVSQQMSALERDTGVGLFQRSARSIQPTEAAVVMTRHAAKVLTDIEALMAAAARTQDSASQELRLGIFPSLATYVLPRSCRTRPGRTSGIDLRVSVAEPGQTIQGLRTGGELDVALVYQVGQSGLAWPHTVNRQWIGDDDFRVVLPGGLGHRHGFQGGRRPPVRHALDHAPPGHLRRHGDRTALRQLQPAPARGGLQRRLPRQPGDGRRRAWRGPGPRTRPAAPAGRRGGASMSRRSGWPATSSPC